MRIAWDAMRGHMTRIDFEIKQLHWPGDVTGHPEQSRMQIAWDARRGYMTCLCMRDAEEPLAIVWDLHSGWHHSELPLLRSIQ